MGTAVIIPAAIAFAVAASCGTTTGASMEPTITIQQANELVAQYLDEARAVLPPQAEFQPRDQEKAGSCDAGGRDNGMVLATKSYRISGLEKDKIPDYFANLRQWWESNGYTVLREEPGYLWVQHDSDEFRLTLKSNDEGRMALIATSPCVWPNGTPGPSS